MPSYEGNPADQEATHDYLRLDFSDHSDGHDEPDENEFVPRDKPTRHQFNDDPWGNAAQAEDRPF